MRRSSSWRAYTLVGLALLIAALVLTASSSDPDEAGERVLRVFAVGILVFFVPVFGFGLWQRRPRDRSALDLIYAELAGSADPPPDSWSW